MAKKTNDRYQKAATKLYIVNGWL